MRERFHDLQNTFITNLEKSHLTKSQICTKYLHISRKYHKGINKNSLKFLMEFNFLYKNKIKIDRYAFFLIIIGQTHRASSNLEIKKSEINFSTACSFHFFLIFRERADSGREGEARKTREEREEKGGLKRGARKGV